MTELEKRAEAWLDYNRDKIFGDNYYIVKDLLAALKAKEWLPIESAPKDGTEIFIWNGNSEFPNRHEVRWRMPTDSEYWVSGSDYPEEIKGTYGNEEGFFDCFGSKFWKDNYPTHWQPLPTPPKQSEAI